MEPLLHPQTEQQLHGLLNRPVHAVLLSGPPGAGKLTLARWVTGQALGIEQNALGNYPYVRIIAGAEGKVIPIEAVRELEHFLALKTPGHRQIGRVVIIPDAHLLTTEAQNALLKTLEEPPKGTLLVLTSAHDDALLSTIRSRVQAIAIKRPTLDQLQEHLKARGYREAAVSSALAVSGGLPGLAITLCENDQEHPYVRAAQTAREILQRSSFNRLTMADVLAKDRAASLDVLFILQQMAHVALLRPGGNAERWQHILTTAYEAQAAVLANAPAKLVMTQLLLSL